MEDKEEEGGDTGGIRAGLLPGREMKKCMTSRVRILRRKKSSFKETYRRTLKMTTQKNPEVPSTYSAKSIQLRKKGGEDDTVFLQPGSGSGVASKRIFEKQGLGDTLKVKGGFFGLLRKERKEGKGTGRSWR